MKQFFPFGRGDRASRQRLVLEFEKWGGRMVVHSFRVKVLQTQAPDAVLFQGGMSVFDGSRQFFITPRFSQAVGCVRRAVINFPSVVKNNRVIRQKRLDSLNEKE